MDISQEARFMAMLKLQSELNSLINPEWLKAGYPYLRAAFVEAGEALDHYGWKWWKSQSPNIVQLQIELIDILHFYLSDVLVESNGDYVTSISNIERELNESQINFDSAVFVFKDLDVLGLIELIGGLAVVKRRSFGLLEELMRRCDLAWEVAYAQYISKNILNIFRQRNGYKQGTYVKVWEGLEDNVWLERFLDTLDLESASFSEDLMSELTAKYLGVLKGASS
ncbi:dUTP diphosphatase [Pseudomonas sp. 29]|uniref:dUTP diphosphatase n=1 Tax=Pseudomonas TaxID=286 RepID=UPI000C17F179|nr:dUTP diphosphatase [Pseudomonas sp. 29]PIF48431.1 dUTPase-like protein [Pseudomonas sp. 29]